MVADPETRSTDSRLGGIPRLLYYTNCSSNCGSPVGPCPRAFGETAIAIALLLGLLTNLASLVGVVLAIVIWTTAEGFGGPYQAGSADIGSAIIHVVVFVGLVLSQSGLYLGLDRWLTPALGRFGFLASVHCRN